MTDPSISKSFGIPARSHDLDYHSARILLIVAAYNEIQKRPLDGLTKLAKLDFLVRYPIFLKELSERALSLELPVRLMPTTTELIAVENRMVRYKYGPWDDRYYPILGTLIGLGLTTSTAGKGRIALTVTDEGATIASDLSGEPSWELMSLRSKFVVEAFNLTGNQLKELIYKELPIVTATRHRHSI